MAPEVNITGGRPANLISKDPPVVPVVTPVQTWGQFAREFLRVEFDKMLLFALSIFLWKIGQQDYAKAAMYGLAVAINHNRFKWN